MSHPILRPFLLLTLLSAAPVGAAGDVALIGVQGPSAPASPLQQAATRLNEATVTFLQGVPPGSFQAMDQAEEQLRRQLAGQASTAEGAALQKRISGMLWLRSQLLFSFATNWSDSPTSPTANDTSRGHLLEALDLQDLLASLTGVRAIDRAALPARFGLPARAN